MGTAKHKNSRIISKALNLALGGLLLGFLWSCTQGGGALAPAGSPLDGPGNQAAAVDNQPILIEADPIDDCTPYTQDVENIDPNDVPENCKAIYEAYMEMAGLEIIREEPVVLERVYPVIEREEDSSDDSPKDSEMRILRENFLGVERAEPFNLNQVQIRQDDEE